MFTRLRKASVSTKKTCKDGVGMNTKTEGVHEAMLKEILKKWRTKSDQYFNKKIQEDYSVLFGKKRR